MLNPPSPVYTFVSIDPEYKPTLLKASCIALDHIHPGVARKVIDLNWQKSSKPIVETIPDSSTVSISKTKVKSRKEKL